MEKRSKELDFVEIQEPPLSLGMHEENLANDDFGGGGIYSLF